LIYLSSLFIVTILHRHHLRQFEAPNCIVNIETLFLALNCLQFLDTTTAHEKFNLRWLARSNPNWLSFHLNSHWLKQRMVWVRHSLLRWVQTVYQHSCSSSRWSKLHFFDTVFLHTYSEVFVKEEWQVQWTGFWRLLDLWTLFVCMEYTCNGTIHWTSCPSWLLDITTSLWWNRLTFEF